MHYVMRLSLAGYVFEEYEKSAAAAEAIRIWFLRNETRMRPTLRFGQGIPGVIQGKGSASMDMYFSGRGFIDSVQLLSLTPNIENIWTPSDQEVFKTWASEFSSYLFYDAQMQSEKKMANNHGVYYDLNVLSWSSISEESFITSQILGSPHCWVKQRRKYNCIEGRIASQIDEGGMFKHEISRADHSHYIWYTLLANAYLVTAASQLNNLAPFSAHYLQLAADWAMPHIISKSDAYIVGENVYAAHAYRMLARVTNDIRYEHAVCKVLSSLKDKSTSHLWSSSKVGVHILNIVMPSVHNSVQNNCKSWRNMPTLHESKDFIARLKKGQNKIPKDAFALLGSVTIFMIIIITTNLSKFRKTIISIYKGRHHKLVFCTTARQM